VHRENLKIAEGGTSDAGYQPNDRLSRPLQRPIPPPPRAPPPERTSVHGDRPKSGPTEKITSHPLATDGRVRMFWVGVPLRREECLFPG